MSRYNHFSKEKYEAVSFDSLANGQKFRMDKRAGNRRRNDIVMVKLSHSTYKELKSGKEYHATFSGFDVRSYDKKLNPTPEQ